MLSCGNPHAKVGEMIDLLAASSWLVVLIARTIYETHMSLYPDRVHHVRHPTSTSRKENRNHLASILVKYKTQATRRTTSRQTSADRTCEGMQVLRKAGPTGSRLIPRPTCDFLLQPTCTQIEPTRRYFRISTWDPSAHILIILV